MRGGTRLQITETIEDEGVVRLALAGELDLSTRAALERRLSELSSRRTLVRLDLSRLEFIDASGLSVLIGWLAETARHSWRLELDRGLAPQVSRVLSAFELDFG